MNKGFIFMLGASIGSLVTWKIVKEKYKRIADEEIDSIREHYSRKLNKLYDNTNNIVKEESEEPLVDDIPDFTNENKEEYKNIVSLYTDGEKIDEFEETEEGIIKLEPTQESIKPYVISPEEYGETNNQLISLMLYSDGVLTDDNDEIIIDYEDIIGDALEHFGEYEEDSVHVRNENNECDYEILKSEKTFDEIYKEDN